MPDEGPVILTVRDPSDHRQLPLLVAVCFGIDVALALIYLVVILSPQVSWKLTDMFHLERESNLPTWYSSVQLLLVGVLFGIFVRARFDRRRLRSWALLALPLLFVALSIDEATQFHEWVGEKLDGLILPTGNRRDTMFAFTGVWVFVLGLPFLAITIALLRYVRDYFSARPQVASKMITGLCIFVLGAVGFESVANFLVIDSIAHAFEVFFEEFFEMVGVTIILWGIVDLLHAHGFEMRIWRHAVNEDRK